MTKRRDFIKKSILGSTGLTIAGIGLGPASSCSDGSAARSSQGDVIWQQDPEWVSVKFGDWGGPGVSSQPGPMDNMLLKDWAPRSLVVTKETFVEKAKYPVIDCHLHIYGRTPDEVSEWVQTMDEVGIEKSVILTGSTGEAFDNLAGLYLGPYPDRFILYCGIDLENIDNDDFSSRIVKELERCHSKGALGVGEISDKGFGITRDTSLPREKRLHPDDSRLDAFWKRCGELGLPVNLHVADHPSCWTPLDVYQERTPDYQHFNMYELDALHFNELLQIRDRTLTKHPGTIFIACHLSNQGHDLEALGKVMDRYPNLYLDTSARDYEMGRTPRSSARFLEKYRDRIVFGTDMGRRKSMFQIHWRLFETDDEYIPGRVGWKYSALNLPDHVLESLYRGTALKIHKAL
jgi:uncharacterized protein